jgi:CheY-like chemotaxis protein
MIQPLALLLYERLLPGSQLANRMRDLNYRVQTISTSESLMSCARQDRPMLVLIDLVSARENFSLAITQLREDPDTQHIPIIAFGPVKAADLQKSARAAGATLVINENALLTHLSQFLDQALQVE